jgi:hypothetical protein
MSGDYGSHADYMARIAEDTETRQLAIEEALRQAFSKFIERRSVEVIVFGSMSVLDLASAIEAHPTILKPLTAACNIAARAIERDLQIKNLDTYKPRVSQAESAAIAAYIKPHLPAYLEIPALSYVDRVYFIDKEIRKGKGRWEQKVVAALANFATVPFKKRKFEVAGEKFELDAATPAQGAVSVGVDIKRIEARRDIHKRCDEIVNKATKLKMGYPKSRFAAFIYYPFVDEHTNVQNRLRSESIDVVVFASDSGESIENAARMLLTQLRIGK